MNTSELHLQGMPARKWIPKDAGGKADSVEVPFKKLRSRCIQPGNTGLSPREVEKALQCEDIANTQEIVVLKRKGL